MTVVRCSSERDRLSKLSTKLLFIINGVYFEKFYLRYGREENKSKNKG